MAVPVTFEPDYVTVNRTDDEIEIRALPGETVEALLDRVAAYHPTVSSIVLVAIAKRTSAEEAA